MPNIEGRITDLKEGFLKIVDFNTENKHMFDELTNKIKKLQATYASYIQNHSDPMYILGLDCFRYQSRIIEVEYEDMKRLYLSITNRIYCEYYKLHQILIKYMKNNISDKKILDLIQNNDNYPKYMDLEPYKEYEMDLIYQLNDVVLLFFSNLNNVLLKKYEELRLHRSKNAEGIYLDNFVETFEFDNIMLEKRICLFISYMEIFQRNHIKYFKRFTNKMTLFSTQINHDIRIEATPKSKERRKSIMNDMKKDNVGLSLMNDIADSIASPQSNSSDDSMEGDIEPVLKIPSEVGLRPALELEHPTDLQEKLQLEQELTREEELKIDAMMEKEVEEATGVETQTDGDEDVEIDVEAKIEKEEKEEYFDTVDEAYTDVKNVIYKVIDEIPDENKDLP